jgi:O-antigen/teichoic acid export membrane protein
MINKIKGLYKSNASNRTAINTLIIYSQRFLSAGLSLITTPIILSALGVKGFGLYTLTFSFVSMLAFLNWSLSSSTQRYIAFAIGEGNTDKLKKVFSTAFTLHLIYGLALFVIICFTDLFFLEKILSIPPERVRDAKIILIFVAVISFITIISIPFLGMLRAAENFYIISIVGIIESILKLVTALSLLFLSGNRIIYYAAFLLSIAIIVFCLYMAIIKKRYKDIPVTTRFYDKGLVKEMLSFLSWSLIGALAVMSRNQGVQVLINMFFGVVKNAAYGIAMQVSAALTILSQGVIGSISPQILKSAGAGDKEKMVFLMRTMSKFAVFSISIAAIPLFFECPAILRLWLGREVPADTVMYVRLIILFGQLQLLSAGIQIVFDALGKVKEYNIWVSIILILNLPISYLLFKLDYPSYSIIIVGMALEFVSLNVRLQLLKKHVGFSMKVFYFDTLFRVLLPSFSVGAIIYMLTLLQLDVFVEIALAFFVTLLIYPVVIYKFSLEGRQKEILSGMLMKFFKTKKKQQA